MSRHGAALARRVPGARPTAPAVMRPPVAATAALWSVGGRRWLALVVLVAALVLGLAWYGCSGQTTWRVQVRWFGLGVFACALNAVGCLVWLGAGVRSLRRERSWTTAELARRGLLPVPGPAEPVPPRDGLVTGVRMRRYHRAECPLMAGKAAETVTTEAAAARSLAPCGVCAP